MDKEQEKRFFSANTLYEVKLIIERARIQEDVSSLDIAGEIMKYLEDRMFNYKHP